MIRPYLILFLILVLISCSKESNQNNNTLVSTPEALNEAILNASPGDEIILSNGIWKDVQIHFTGEGTENRPIIIRAKSPGEVFIEGQSELKFGGQYLEVHDLYFRNGFTPSSAVIEFRTDDDQVASHCRVSNCVIEDYNQLKRDKQDLWVAFWGRHNIMDHCYIAGKSNRGPTIRVNLEGNESIKNYHQIVNNHFGPRPRKGGPSGETIQIGVSSTSMTPCYTMVANNLFDRCNGEVEVISSKANFNEFRNNVFYKCEGSLVTRHGNYCLIDGNYFIGDDNSNNIGGIRIINTGHWVTNNYFYNLKGENFRSPLAVMNGIPKSPLNRYNQVTDAVITHNTWVNCKSPLQFGVGSNISQKDVLPASEIRSARPIRTIVANNLIHNANGDPSPVVAHDTLDGVSFKSNLIANQDIAFDKMEGLEATSVALTEIEEYIFVPNDKLSATNIYKGFDFQTIEKDIFENSRTEINSVGASVKAPATKPGILDPDKYGPDWFSTKKENPTSKTHSISPEDNDLTTKVATANDGDIVQILPGNYEINSPIFINKNITIQSSDENVKSVINYTGSSQTPAFEMQPKGMLTLKNVILKGNDSQFAFASMPDNMSSLYNLTVSGCEISQFDYILKAYKETFADEIIFSHSLLKNSNNGIELAAETNDRGDYNAEFLLVDNCQFEGIKKNVIDYYRGGYDESTIGGNLSVTNSLFTNCGQQEENGILLNTRGIINVDISKNTFKNNQVKLVALLWGAKNNSHSENIIINSGKILVEENLALKLMY